MFIVKGALKTGRFRRFAPLPQNNSKRAAITIACSVSFLALVIVLTFYFAFDETVVTSTLTDPSYKSYLDAASRSISPPSCSCSASAVSFEQFLTPHLTHDHESLKSKVCSRSFPEAPDPSLAGPLGVLDLQRGWYSLCSQIVKEAEDTHRKVLRGVLTSPSAFPEEDFQRLVEGRVAEAMASFRARVGVLADTAPRLFEAFSVMSENSTWILAQGYFPLPRQTYQLINAYGGEQDWMEHGLTWRRVPEPWARDSEGSQIDYSTIDPNYCRCEEDGCNGGMVRDHPDFDCEDFRFPLNGFDGASLANTCNGPWNGEIACQFFGDISTVTLESSLNFLCQDEVATVPIPPGAECTWGFRDPVVAKGWVAPLVLGDEESTSQKLPNVCPPNNSTSPDKNMCAPSTAVQTLSYVAIETPAGEKELEGELWVLPHHIVNQTTWPACKRFSSDDCIFTPTAKWVGWGLFSAGITFGPDRQIVRPFKASPSQPYPYNPCPPSDQNQNLDRPECWDHAPEFERQLRGTIPPGDLPYWQGCGSLLRYTNARHQSLNASRTSSPSLCECYFRDLNAKLWSVPSESQGWAWPRQCAEVPIKDYPIGQFLASSGFESFEAALRRGLQVEWSYTGDHSLYFAQCAPGSCEFAERRKRTLTEIASEVLKLAGSLITVLTIVFGTIYKCWDPEKPAGGELEESLLSSSHVSLNRLKA